MSDKVLASRKSQGFRYFLVRRISKNKGTSFHVLRGMNDVAGWEKPILQEGKAWDTLDSIVPSKRGYPSARELWDDYYCK